MKEIWKDVLGYEGLYEVSNTGKVRSLDRTSITKLGKERLFKGKILKQSFCRVKNDKGYYMVGLRKDKKTTSKYVHRLILEAFVEIPKRLKGLIQRNIVCDHIDNNSENNTLDNLQWLSRTENISKDINKVKIRIVETGETFSSQSELVQHLMDIGYCNNSNLSGAISNIRKQISGESRYMYGYKYEYVEEK